MQIMWKLFYYNRLEFFIKFSEYRNVLLLKKMLNKLFFALWFFDQLNFCRFLIKVFIVKGLQMNGKFTGFM